MKRVVSVTYYGNCPTCGERQSSSKPEYVDTDCGICEGKKEIKRLHDTKYKVLEQGIVQGITGYDEKGMPSMMSIITNDFVYDLEFKEITISNVWRR